MDELLDKIERRAYQTKVLAWLIHICEPDTDFAKIQESNATALLFDLLEEQVKDISEYVLLNDTKKKQPAPKPTKAKG